MTVASGELAHITGDDRPGVDDADRRAVEARVRAAGTSFYWAMRLLPPAKRAAIYAVYAFCREVDDIADEPGQETQKRARLEAWRAEIGALYDGRPRHPVSRALTPAVAAFGLVRGDFEAVIAGMEMDASDRLRLSDRAELSLYCDRVACAVGRLSVRIFGIEEPLGSALAAAQGEALQLTNILRDLVEDAARDRLYLPADLLADHGIDAAAPLDAILADGAIPDVLADLAAVARARFDSVDVLVGKCVEQPDGRRLARPAIVMAKTYELTLQRLNARGWSRWREPVRISKAEKLWVGLRYAFG